MFEDLYKSANNRIETADAKKRLMSKIERLPEKKPVRLHGFEYGALMAACLMIAFFGINMAKEHNVMPKTEDPFDVSQIGIVSQTPKGEDNPQTSSEVTANTPKQADVAPKATAPKGVTTPKGTTYKSEVKVDVQVESYAPPAVAVAEKLSGEDATKDHSANETPATSGEEITDLPSSRRTAEVDDRICVNAMEIKPQDLTLAMEQLEGREFTELTYEEYSNYLGTDAAEEILNDCGLVFEAPQMVLLDGTEGVYENDEVVLAFSKDGKSASLTTSKNTETVDAYIFSDEYQKSIISGVSAVIFGGDDMYEAYMRDEDIAYTLVTQNFREEELVEVLNALAK